MAVSHGWQRPARGMGRGKGARGEPSERDRAKSRTQNAVGWERWWFLSALPLPLFNRCSSAAARTCCHLPLLLLPVPFAPLVPSPLVPLPSFLACGGAAASLVVVVVYVEAQARAGYAYSPRPTRGLSHAHSHALRSDLPRSLGSNTTDAADYVANKRRQAVAPSSAAGAPGASLLLYDGHGRRVDLDEMLVRLRALGSIAKVCAGLSPADSKHVRLGSHLPPPRLAHCSWRRRSSCGRSRLIRPDSCYRSNSLPLSLARDRHGM